MTANGYATPRALEPGRVNVTLAPEVARVARRASRVAARPSPTRRATASCAWARRAGEARPRAEEGRRRVASERGARKFGSRRPALAPPAMSEAAANFPPGCDAAGKRVEHLSRALSPARRFDEYLALTGEVLADDVHYVDPVHELRGRADVLATSSASTTTRWSRSGSFRSWARSTRCSCGRAEAGGAWRACSG
jgi:hypothetical protein